MTYIQYYIIAPYRLIDALETRVLARLIFGVQERYQAIPCQR